MSVTCHYHVVLTFLIARFKTITSKQSKYWFIRVISWLHVHAKISMFKECISRKGNFPRLKENFPCKECLSWSISFSKYGIFKIFLVACTRHYKPLCWSVGRSVGLLETDCLEHATYGDRPWFISDTHLTCDPIIESGFER